MATALQRPGLVSAPITAQAFSMKKFTTHKPLAVLGRGIEALGETSPPRLVSGSSFTSESAAEVSQPLVKLHPWWGDQGPWPRPLAPVTQAGSSSAMWVVTPGDFRLLGERMLLSNIFAIADTGGYLPGSFSLSPALFAQMFLPRLVINLGRGQLEKKKIKKKRPNKLKKLQTVNLALTRLSQISCWGCTFQIRF